VLGHSVIFSPLFAPDEQLAIQSNLLVFTNHPHHYGWEDEPDPAKDNLSFFYNNTSSGKKSTNDYSDP
jgi:hypothetical protein